MPTRYRLKYGSSSFRVPCRHDLRWNLWLHGSAAGSTLWDFASLPHVFPSQMFYYSYRCRRRHQSASRLGSMVSCCVLSILSYYWRKAYVSVDWIGYVGVLHNLKTGLKARSITTAWRLSSCATVLHIANLCYIHSLTSVSVQQETQRA